MRSPLVLCLLAAAALLSACGSLAPSRPAAWSKPQPLVVAMHHHIPEHGPIEAVAGGPAEADQGPTLPTADGGLAALKHLPEGFAAPALGPKAVPIQQLLQLVQAPWL